MSSVLERPFWEVQNLQIIGRSRYDISQNQLGSSFLIQKAGKSSSTGVTSDTITFLNPTNPGSVLVLMVSHLANNANATTSITDSATQTWTKEFELGQTTAPTTQCQCYAITSGSVSITSVTVHFAFSSNYACEIYEFASNAVFPALSDSSSTNSFVVPGPNSTGAKLIISCAVAGYTAGSSQTIVTFGGTITQSWLSSGSGGNTGMSGEASGTITFSDAAHLLVVENLCIGMN